jgi:hypothetical protein
MVRTGNRAPSTAVSLEGNEYDAQPRRILPYLHLQLVQFAVSGSNTKLDPSIRAR